MHAATDRQSTAFDTLLRFGLKRRSALFQLCLRWTKGNRADAEDLLSEACLRVLESSCVASDPMAFWATTISNLGRDRFRRLERRRALAWRATGTPPESAPPESMVLSRHILTSTLANLSLLPPQQGNALAMRANGMAYRDIAQQLGTRQACARKLVQLARSQLRRTFACNEHGSAKHPSNRRSTCSFSWQLS